MTDLGLSFTVLLPDTAAEPAPYPGERPEEFALRAASAKARNVAAKLDISGPNPGSRETRLAVIAADTVVSLDGVLYGKPLDSAHALSMLRELAGRTHQVVTACSILHRSLPSLAVHTPAWNEESFFVTSDVTFWNAGNDLLQAYARTAEPLDKAGAYAVQGMGAFLAERLCGSWSNVVGLPLAELCRALLRLEIITYAPCD